MACRKIVFLDIDGVLNSTKYRKDHPEGRDNKAIDPGALARLEVLLQATDASVVVSSTWRMEWSLFKLQTHLFRKGMHEKHILRFIGATPKLAAKRGREIDTWLKYAPPVEAFIILDDSSDMTPYMRRLIRVDNEYGLLDSHVQKAVAMLKDP